MLDDVVMGGASSSRVSQADHGGTFSGSVTTRFNGGFCSARCLPASVQDLKDFDGLAVRVLCEQGMRYKLILRENTARGGVAWCYSFDTVPGEVTTMPTKWHLCDVPNVAAQQRPHHHFMAVTCS